MLGPGPRCGVEEFIRVSLGKFTVLGLGVMSWAPQRLLEIVQYWSMAATAFHRLCWQKAFVSMA